MTLVSAPVGLAAAAESVGETRKVVRVVTGEIESNLRTLIVGDPVHLDETITTELQASTHIVFDDDSNLVLGPNTTIVLDEFVYTPTRSASEIVLDTTRGALRFITGVASKDSYRLNTPMATVGIRGTDFMMFIDRFGTTMILLRSGIVRLCRAGVIDIWAPTADCIDLEVPATWALANSEGLIGPFPWDGDSISDILSDNRPDGATEPVRADGLDLPGEEPERFAEELLRFAQDGLTSGDDFIQTADTTGRRTGRAPADGGDGASAGLLFADLQAVIASSDPDTLTVELADYIAARCAEEQCVEATRAAFELAATPQEDGSPNPAAGALGVALWQVAGASRASNPEFSTAIEDQANFYVQQCTELQANDEPSAPGICTAVASYTAQAPISELGTATTSGTPGSES